MTRALDEYGGGSDEENSGRSGYGMYTEKKKRRVEGAGCEVVGEGGERRGCGGGGGVAELQLAEVFRTLHGQKPLLTQQSSSYVSVFLSLSPFLRLSLSLPPSLSLALSPFLSLSLSVSVQIRNRSLVSRWIQHIFQIKRDKEARAIKRYKYITPHKASDMHVVISSRQEEKQESGASRVKPGDNHLLLMRCEEKTRLGPIAPAY